MWVLFFFFIIIFWVDWTNETASLTVRLFVAVVVVVVGFCHFVWQRADERHLTDVIVAFSICILSCALALIFMCVCVCVWKGFCFVLENSSKSRAGATAVWANDLRQTYFRIFNQRTFQNCRKAKVLDYTAACIADEIWAQIMNRRHVKGLTSAKPSSPMQLPWHPPAPAPTRARFLRPKKKKDIKHIKPSLPNESNVEPKLTLISRKSSTTSSSSDPLIWFLWLCANSTQVKSSQAKPSQTEPFFFSFIFIIFYSSENAAQRLKSNKFFSQGFQAGSAGQLPARRVKWSTPKSACSPRSEWKLNFKMQIMCAD